MTLGDLVIPFVCVVFVVTIAWIVIAHRIGNDMHDWGRSATVWTIVALALPPVAIAARNRTRQRRATNLAAGSLINPQRIHPDR